MSTQNSTKCYGYFICNLCFFGFRGYLAPEYAIRGQLTRKADIYSFGILLLEIVTGGRITNKRLHMKEQHFLEKVSNYLYSTLLQVLI